MALRRSPSSTNPFFSSTRAEAGLLSRTLAANGRASRSAMPAHKMGRKWKFKREQVDAWVEAGGAAANEARERDTDTEGRDG